MSMQASFETLRREMQGTEGILEDFSLCFQCICCYTLCIINVWSFCHFLHSSHGMMSTIILSFRFSSFQRNEIIFHSCFSTDTFSFFAMWTIHQMIYCFVCVHCDFFWESETVWLLPYKQNVKSLSHSKRLHWSKMLKHWLFSSQCCFLLVFLHKWEWMITR